MMSDSIIKQIFPDERIKKVDLHEGASLMSLLHDFVYLWYLVYLCYLFLLFLFDDRIGR